MEQNKVRTYILYAVGEIVLVMIGILLALQVNNWNEERIQRQEEIQVLQNVRSDFQEGIEEIEFLNGIRRQMVQAIDEITSDREYILQHYSTHEIDSLLSILTSIPTFNNKSGSLEVLLNSGRINLVRDHTLRNLLISWPGEVDDMIEGEVDQEELDRDYARPFMRRYVSMNNIYRHFKLGGIPDSTFDTFERESIVESNYEDLFMDPEFENILVNREMLLQIAIVESDELIALAEDIISRINLDIGD